jgi:hypothetical protein
MQRSTPSLSPPARVSQVPWLASISLEQEADAHAAALQDAPEMGALAPARVATPEGDAPLDPALRSAAERQFDGDFSGVRIHADEVANRESRALGAQAFAHGESINFAAGRYRPDTRAGRHLVFHELSHVAQQARVGTAIQRRANESSNPQEDDTRQVQLLREIQDGPAQGLRETVRLSSAGLQQLDALLQGEEGASEDMPALESDDTGTATPIAGTPFVAGAGDRYGSETRDRQVHINDVRQGALADCYFVAILGAIARQRPGVIHDMIRDNGDGTYTVTFHRRGPGGVFGVRRDHAVTVNNQFWTRSDGTQLYAKAGDAGPSGPELWVMLIEKAWAQLRGGYENIRGASVSWADAIGTVTGRAHTTILTADLQPAALFNRVKSHFVNRGLPVIFPTPGNRKKIQANNVIANHAYVLNEVNEPAQTVDLYNPWGTLPLNGIDMAFVRGNFQRIMLMDM